MWSTYVALQCALICWDEIHQVIDDGQLEISPGHNIPIEVFLRGNYLSIPCYDQRQLFKEFEIELTVNVSNVHQCKGLADSLASLQATTQLFFL